MKDVLIRTTREKIAHKMESEFENPEKNYCWWTVNGKPRQCEEGDKIMFSDGERVFAEGKIRKVVKGEIEFEPVKKVVKPNPKKPPTRGFIYV